MPKVRVYELAKQLSVSNKVVLDLLAEYGMPASNHMSTVDDNAAEFVIRRVRKGRAKSSDSEDIGATQIRGEHPSSDSANLQDLARRDGERPSSPSRRESSFGPRRRSGRLRQSDVIPAKPAIRFDKPTYDDGKLIKFDVTTYFDTRSSSGGMRAIYTSRAKPVEKPKPKAEGEPQPVAKTEAPAAETKPVEQPATVSKQVEEQAAKSTVAEPVPAQETVPEIKAKTRAPAEIETEVPPAAAPEETVAQEKTELSEVSAQAETEATALAEPAGAQDRGDEGDASDRGQVTLRRVRPEDDRRGADERQRRSKSPGGITGGTRKFDVPVDLVMPMSFQEGTREATRRGKKKGSRREELDSDEFSRERKSAGKRSAKRARLIGDDVDLDDDTGYVRRIGRAPSKARAKAQDQAKDKKRTKVEKTKTLSIPDSLTVRDFALRLEVSAADLIKKLMSLGVMANLNDTVDFETCEIVADEYGVKLNRLSEVEERELTVEDIVDDPESLVPRPPVVTVLGHVDHGKTSLLDKIRKTRVTETEAGGITQHIGAYQVDVGDRKITFIDTPGHEAFTAMRARGAQVTDIAILVVAADDGVMPQTVEAINHARAAQVPIIVAVNKIDKPTAQPERVRQQLSEYELIPEQWGGDTVYVDISALTGQGIDELLDMILLVADLRELKANPNRPAKGYIIEAKLDKGRGPVATVLIKAGTLRVGDAVIAGTAYGRVRAMTNHLGQFVAEAGPSTPVEIIGFNEVPQAGDVLNVVEDEKTARDIAAKRLERKRSEELLATQRVSLDDFYQLVKEGETKELGIIVKGDVQGSVEALCQSLEKLSTDEVKVKIVHSGVGAITESDVMLASTAGAIIIGFNVRPDASARKSAEREGIDIRLYRIIYEAIDDVKKALSGVLEPEIREKVIGHAEVRAIFKIPKAGTVAGCYVTDGVINRNALVRVLRDGVVVHEGAIESLKRFKDDVREVAEGFECGVALERFNDVREGDTLEVYVKESVKRSL